MSLPKWVVLSLDAGNAGDPCRVRRRNGSKRLAPEGATLVPENVGSLPLLCRMNYLCHISLAFSPFTRTMKWPKAYC